MAALILGNLYSLRGYQGVVLRTLLVVKIKLHVLNFKFQIHINALQASLWPCTLGL